MKLIKEPIIVDFIEFEDGSKFEYSKIINTINQFTENTIEDDKYGENSLRDYELEDKDITNYLVKLGLVKAYIGPKMSHCYCAKDMKGLDKLREDIYSLYY